MSVLLSEEEGLPETATAVKIRKRPLMTPLRSLAFLNELFSLAHDIKPEVQVV